MTSSTTGAAFSLGGMSVTLIMQIGLSNGRKAYSKVFKIKFRDVQLRYITVFKTCFYLAECPTSLTYFYSRVKGTYPVKKLQVCV